MARIGYARVSTIDQDADIQIDKLKAEGCEVIRAEKVSGASRAGRVELETIIQFLRPGGADGAALHQGAAARGHCASQGRWPLQGWKATPGL